MSEAESRSREGASIVAHTLQVMRSIDHIDLAMDRMESAQRSYLSTGKASLIVDRDAEMSKLHIAAGVVKNLVTDNPVQQHRVEQLEDFAAMRLSEMNANIRRQSARESLTNSDPPGLARPEPAAQGRRLNEELKDEELRLLATRMQSQDDSNDKTLSILTAPN